ncbi:hypothetical protein ACS0TY_004166 [Phlomoides rotata]
MQRNRLLVVGDAIKLSGAGGVASRCQLQESNGRLYHFIIVSHLGDKSIAVYKLQENYSEWLLKYHDGFDRLPGRFCIMSFIQGDDGETCTLVTHVPEGVAYMFLDKSSEELIDLTNEPVSGKIQCSLIV